ncbi:GMC family oxidoreductase [Pseudonocardia nigra]|uniref:GMC family oxidoreductase n=1 Tax=Pseudonocardia nigra TaxID=1921578 RepID=UPI001C5F5449|nr:GMC family oxidoreductase [Pseudonocardia nigra]
MSPIQVDPGRDGLISLSPYEARIAAAIFERMFPPGPDFPGAVDIGVITYLDRALAGHDRHLRDIYHLGLAALDRAARDRCGTGFADCAPDEQDGLIADLEAARLPAFHAPEQHEFFCLLRAHLQEGLFADPAHGGNRDKAGWRFLGHPGVWLEHSAAEQQAEQSVTKDGEIRSLADAGYRLGGSAEETPPEIPGYDPQRAAAEPPGPADVIIVGMGAIGGFVSALLADAGLRVVGFEAGGWRHRSDYHPDELGAAYYCRGDMGPKFLSEAPRWRRNDGEPTQPITFSLGRMMNGVGGSIVHWGGALRRMHPYQFAYRSHIAQRWGLDVLPEHSTVADWPLDYTDLEPYYDLCERIAGVAGDRYANPFVPRGTDYPMPPLRPTRKGELFTSAARDLGLHPHPTPVCVNSVPYNGLPATRYHPWSAGFGSFHDDRWNPGLTSVPQALASGNLDLRTHCRVLRILTDRSGHADGVEYVDPHGVIRTHHARTVIVAGYTFETVRLLLLSGGLGDATGQLGKHFMVKQWGDVYAHFPDTVFNAHTGPAAQMVTLDDFNAADFDCVANGFVGGASLNVENQQLPLQIARDPVPPDVAAWGRPYQEHLRRWQHVMAVRIQPDSLSYTTDHLDLDPRYRDRSGLGIPVLRVTTDMRPNEHRLQDHMQQQCTRILERMGAVRTWNGPRFRGVASSHDLGGARMGDDPRSSVVSRDLQVHDTPGLYVFSGATFPTCTGINPHLTLMAITARATEQLIHTLGGARRGGTSRRCVAPVTGPT